MIAASDLLRAPERLAIGQQVRILSLSLGLPGYEETFRPIVKIIRQRGILPVFAVGNEGPGTSRWWRRASMCFPARQGRPTSSCPAPRGLPFGPEALKKL